MPEHQNCQCGITTGGRNCIGQKSLRLGYVCELQQLIPVVVAAKQWKAAKDAMPPDCISDCDGNHTGYHINGCPRQGVGVLIPAIGLKHAEERLLAVLETPR